MGIRKTPFDTRVEILANFWHTYRDEEEEKDFIDFHDLGLPLAFMLANDFVYKASIEDTPAEELIHETFELLLKHWDISEDTGFQELDDVVGAEDLGPDFMNRIAAEALRRKNSAD